MKGREERKLSGCLELVFKARNSAPNTLCWHTWQNVTIVHERRFTTGNAIAYTDCTIIDITEIKEEINTPMSDNAQQRQVHAHLFPNQVSHG